jgi:MerR family transcriptional regulator, redox-sensitive transcriptional activator SoxR
MPVMTEMLTIGQVADAAGVNASAIRYYERHGILPEPARVGGKRRYDADALRRLSVLDMAKRAGFSLEEIRQLFEATEGGAPAHTQLKRLGQRRLPELEALIERATEVKGWLEAASGCTCDTLGECSLFAQGPPGASTEALASDPREVDDSTLRRHEHLDPERWKAKHSAK